MSEDEIRRIMLDLPNNFNEEKLEGISGTIQIQFSGEGTSNWILVFKEQMCNVSEGFAENPDLTLRTDAGIGAKIFTGESDPMRAYMLGKLRVSGDLSLGMKITKLLSSGS